MKGSNNEVEIYSRQPITALRSPKRPVYDRDAAERHWERLLLALYYPPQTPRVNSGLDGPFSRSTSPSSIPIAHFRSGRSRSAGMRLAYIGGIVAGAGSMPARC